MVVQDLSKSYKNFYAVDHLTFGIHKEECFGLLGVNGAGKTTTFMMLTGDCYPSDGDAFINRLTVRNNMKKVSISELTRSYTTCSLSLANPRGLFRNPIGLL